MELLSPAGNVEKLGYAYAYGADAAYIGLKRFSLRIKADNFYEDEYKRVIALKEKYPGKKLHCALNIAFHNRDVDALIANLDYFKQYPIDAFIVQDIGIVPILQKHFPNAHLHVSTQASCMNRETVKMYKTLGFDRVVLGREVGLTEIREIKDAVPDMEIEVFAHGAMCIAYSGRCLMSAYLTGRSAQSGFCSHTCRWEYDLGVEGPAKSETLRQLQENGGVISPEAAKEIAQSGILRLQERQRPGELFPVFEGDDFTAILSSKDLCMINHLDDLKAAGVDSLKIEGRMKSIYYVAMVTRAYRKALDALDGKISAKEAEPFIASLEDVAHRESTTGFYYSRTEADKTTVGASDSPYMLGAQVLDRLSDADEQAVLDRARTMLTERSAKLKAMHPQARAALERDWAQHPEKCPAAAEPREGWHFYRYNPLNKTDAGTALEFITPDVLTQTVAASEYQFVNPDTGEILPWVNPDHPAVIYTPLTIADGTLVRVKDEGYKPGTIRTTGR
ncbi:MAG: U32 family peptidase [Treponema sp.]|nr:U32 family peptidase [Treponema sp.]